MLLDPLIQPEFHWAQPKMQTFSVYATGDFKPKGSLSKLKGPIVC